MQRHNRISVFGSLMAIGVVSSFVSAVTGSGEAGAATGGALAFFQSNTGKGLLELLKSAGTIGTEIFTDDASQFLNEVAERLLDSQPKQNHDIAKAVRQAILAIIRAAEEEIADAQEKAYLIKLTQTDEEAWAWVELLEKDLLEEISEDKIPNFFSHRAGDFAEIQSPLSKGQWKLFLLELSRRNSVFPANETLEKVSQSLYEKFPTSLREVFAQDFANDGKAYGKLLLSLVSDVRARLGEISRDTRQIPEILEKQNKTLRTVQEISENLDVNSPSWRIIDAGFLKRKRITSEEVLKNRAIQFFDIVYPMWADALSPLIPKREIVEQLVKRIKTVVAANNRSVTLLSGAGGEGKTTAFLQAICQLVEIQNNLKILWQTDPLASLPKGLARRIADSDETWIIAADEAYSVADSLYKNLEFFGREEKQDVHFFLCSRTTDWKSSGAERKTWRRNRTDFREIPLEGLSPVDARRIVEKWNEHGQMGMKGLYQKSLDEAAEELLTEANRENYEDERKVLRKSLFGALIRVRERQSEDSYVSSILERLEDRDIFKNSDATLLDAFAHIAILDAEGYPLVTKKLLAKVFNCDEGEVNEFILNQLADETVAFKYEKVILTRHRSIAEIAVRILKEFGKDCERILVRLIKSAQAIYLLNQRDLYNAPKWNEIPKHYFDKGNRELGILLAETFVETKPADCYYLNNLASLLRKAGERTRSVQIYADAPEIIRSQRSFYSEWATAYGNISKDAVDAWLTGIGLADNKNLNRLDEIDAKICLNGLAIVFRRLSQEKPYIKAFKSAFGAASQLGIKLIVKPPKTVITHKNLTRLEKDRTRMRLPSLDNRTAINHIKVGIIKAWQIREIDLPEWVTPGEELFFEDLAALLNKSSATTGR